VLGLCVVVEVFIFRQVNPRTPFMAKRR
jgi:hypothetical protein